MPVAKLYDGSDWVPAIIGAQGPQGPQGDPGIVIDEGSGFNDGDILVYDATFDVWVPQMPELGGLVAVKHVIKTDAEAITSVAAGANVAVSGLSITHALSNESNRLVLMAYFGSAASSRDFAQVGIALADDGTLIGIGDAAGSRGRVTAGGHSTGSSSNRVVTMPHIHLVHTPGDTNAHTYTVRIINAFDDSATLYINRSLLDTNDLDSARSVSALTLMEVSV